MGQNKAHKHELRQAYDTPAARLVTATDRDQMGLLTPSARDVVVSMDGVQNLVGFGTIMDVVNGRLTGTDSIALREIDTQDGIEILAGRKALPGEAIIGIEAMDRLRLTGPTGFVQNSSGMQFPIVGMYRAPQPFDDLNAGALTAADGELFTWRVVTTDVSEVPRVSESLGALLASPAGHAFIESGYEKLASAIVYPGLSSDDACILFLGILAAGAFFVAIVVFADVLVSRSDLGRRRALGATRSMVTGLVVGRNTAAGLVGALTAILIVTVSGAISPFFGRVPCDATLAVAILAVMMTIVASIPPAVFAGHRDPVRVLRTP